MLTIVVLLSNDTLIVLLTIVAWLTINHYTHSTPRWHIDADFALWPFSLCSQWLMSYIMHRRVCQDDLSGQVCNCRVQVFHFFPTLSCFLAAVQSGIVLRVPRFGSLEIKKCTNPKCWVLTKPIGWVQQNWANAEHLLIFKPIVCVTHLSLQCSPRETTGVTRR